MGARRRAREPFHHRVTEAQRKAIEFAFSVPLCLCAEIRLRYCNAAAIFPVAITSAIRAKSWYITRSLSTFADTVRMAA
jgi:hypothetical protein